MDPSAASLPVNPLEGGRDPFLHVGHHGFSRLHAAVADNALESVHALCNRDSVNVTDVWGRTPLHCIRPCPQIPDTGAHIAVSLLNAGANINAVDSAGNTALHCIEDVRAARRILDYTLPLQPSQHPDSDFAHVSWRNARGQTALDAARSRDDNGVANALSKAMESTLIRFISAYGRTYKKHRSIELDIVFEVLAAGADPHLANERGVTLLHVAAIYNSAALVRHLVDAGVDVNTPDGVNNTPLHYAWSHNAVRALLAAGADGRVRNAADATPAQLMRADGRPALAHWVQAASLALDKRGLAEAKLAAGPAVGRDSSL